MQQLSLSFALSLSIPLSGGGSPGPWCHSAESDGALAWRSRPSAPQRQSLAAGSGPHCAEVLTYSAQSHLTLTKKKSET